MDITDRNQSSLQSLFFSREPLVRGGRLPTHTVGDQQVVGGGRGLSSNIWTVARDPGEADRPDHSRLFLTKGAGTWEVLG